MDMDQIQDATNWLMNLGAVPFTVFTCILIGYVFRAIPIFPNKWIPIVVILTGESFLLWNPMPSSTTRLAFYSHSAVGGLFIGMVAWLLHDKFVKQFEDKLAIKFPASALIFTSTSEDGTKHFTKRDLPGMSVAPADGQAGDAASLVTAKPAPISAVSLASRQSEPTPVTADTPGADRVAGGK